MATVASRLRGARSASWQWFKPRTVPVIVALTGMLAVLGSAEYLTRLARRTPQQAVMEMEMEMEPARIATLQAAALDPPPGVLTIDQGPPSAFVILDRNPLPLGRIIQLPSSGYPIRIQLVPTAR